MKGTLQCWIIQFVYVKRQLVVLADALCAGQGVREEIQQDRYSVLMAYPLFQQWRSGQE